MDWWTRLATKHEDWWARIAEEVGTTLFEVFSKTNSTDSVRLLPWCISTVASPGTIPMHYMSEALATTVQWRLDAPAVTTTCGSKGSQAPASMSSLACQCTVHPVLLHLFPFFPCWTFPLLTPPAGCSLVRFIIDPQHKKWNWPPVVHLPIDLARGPMSKLQRLTSAVGIALHWARGNCPKCHQRHSTMEWLPLAVLKNMTVRTTPITVVTSLPKTSQRRMQPIPIWGLSHLFWCWGSGH